MAFNPLSPLFSLRSNSFPSSKTLLAFNCMYCVDSRMCKMEWRDFPSELTHLQPSATRKSYKCIQWSLMSVINMKIRVATDLTLRFHHSNETTLIMQSHIKKFTLSPVSPLTKKSGTHKELLPLLIHLTIYTFYFYPRKIIYFFILVCFNTLKMNFEEWNNFLRFKLMFYGDGTCCLMRVKCDKKLVKLL